MVLNYNNVNFQLFSNWIKSGMSSSGIPGYNLGPILINPVFPKSKYTLAPFFPPLVVKTSSLKSHISRMTCHQEDWISYVYLLVPVMCWEHLNACSPFGINVFFLMSISTLLDIVLGNIGGKVGMVRKYIVAYLCEKFFRKNPSHWSLLQYWNSGRGFNLCGFKQGYLLVAYEYSVNWLDIYRLASE